MAKKKRLRIAAVKTIPNVTHAGAQLKGRWPSIFHNEHPITLELGCGKGDYTLALAQKHPQRNFIGVDLKGARLWVAANKALDLELKNVFYIRANALDLAEIFEANDIAEVWIPFPDPYPKKPRKRMTAPRYLDIYKKICRPGAMFHLKTDDDVFYLFSIESLQQYGCTIHQNSTDVHSCPEVDDNVRITTFYESKHIATGLLIKYIEFTLPEENMV
ncbi:tRNA (guanosine(46)-N7)-methyltransferase TrmB [candidate division KSB1 bacterium]|nr:tRNA (guanosine(46)-N7)-methyltransferase TrmB [candidate division KSB1 bacterium]